MPIISTSKDIVQNPSGFANPKSVERNSVRVAKSGEFTLIKFINDLEDGDKSRFHRINDVTSSGKTFTKYIYCLRVNRNEKGQIVKGNCETCLSPDVNLKRTSPRYSYWVFNYANFHRSQNPRLEQTQEAESWEPFTIGKQVFFREMVMRPQLLTLSHTVWERLAAIAARVGSLLSDPYEYSRQSANERTQYYIEKSTLAIPDVDASIVEVAKSLPNLEAVAAGQIMEVNFPTIPLPSSVARDEQAFQRMVENEQAAAEEPKKGSKSRKPAADEKPW